MKPILIAGLLVCCMLFNACSSSFLVSTLNSTSNPYIPQPVKQKNEPNKTETYAGLQVSPGFNFENWEDYFNSADFRVAQGHALGGFRVAYSANVMLGTFYLQKGGNNPNENYNDYRQQHGGGKFMGAVGGNASISYAVPFRNNGGEWRVFGVQGSLFNEFGDYLTFRQHIPEEFNLDVEQSNLKYSAGFFTEWVRQKMDRQIGMRIGMSFSLLRNMVPEKEKIADSGAGWIVYEPSNRTDIPPFPYYFYLTQFLRKKQFNGYFQFNLGTAISNFQIGVLYTFSHPAARKSKAASLPLSNL